MKPRLYNRKLTPDQLHFIEESGLTELIRSPYGENLNSHREIMKSLGFSTPFLKFIKFIRDHGDLDSAAIIDVGTEFKAQFKNDARKLPDGQKMHWGRSLLQYNPNILKAAGFSIEFEQVLHAWHSILTHTDNTYTAVCAILDGTQKLQDSQQFKLIRNLGHAPQATNTRYSSEAMEDITGLRPGRVSGLALGDDVRENFPSIILNKSYAELDVNPDEFVFFTVHTSFFFICKKSDLLKWLQSNEAREAFMSESNDPFRIEGFSFPATERDLNTLGVLVGQSIPDLLSSLRSEIPEHVPRDKILNALAGKLQKEAKSNASKSPQAHLDWGSPEILRVISR